MERGDRLRPGAIIIPHGTGWRVRVDGQISPLRARVGRTKRDALLDLLDGCHGRREIAATLGVRASDLEGDLAELSRLGLLDDGPAEPADGQRRVLGPAGDEPEVAAGSWDVLLAGLGDVGLAMLEELLAAACFTVHLLDPAPVEAADVGGFYDRGDPGRDKLDVVWEALAPAARRRVRRVPVAGRGGADAVAAIASAVAACRLALCCSDGPSHLLVAMAAACRSQGVPLVAVEAGEDEGWVGPALVGPAGRPAAGCPVCAERHRAARDPLAPALAAHLGARFPRPARWRHRLGDDRVRAMARLAMLAVWRVIDAETSGRAEAIPLVAIDRGTGALRTVAVPAHPACACCFRPGTGGRSRLRREIECRWQASYRRPPTEPLDLDTLWRLLRPTVGAEYGLFAPTAQLSAEQRVAIRRFFRDRGLGPAAHPIANAHVATVVRPHVSGAHRVDQVSGALDFESPRRAEALALMEGLERFFTLDFWERRRVVRARFAAIHDEALDPRRAPLYDDAQYAEPGFPLRRFDPDQTIEWVWGMRLPDHVPVLVPFDLVFSMAGRRLNVPTSSGAACHSSLHDAVLNGLYEVVERDALMVAWLNRLSLPGVTLDAGDPDPCAVRGTLDALGLDCAHVDLTTDLGIPVMLAVLTDRQDPDFYLLDMVAGLDPATQLRKLYRELVQFLHPHLIDQAFYRSPISLGEDVEQVKRFPDHLRFYQHRDKIARAAFLTAAPCTRRWGEGPYADGPLGVQEQLDVLVQRLHARGHEVIVVDCTVPWLEALGLWAVRVLVPGLVPLTPGHRLRALGGTRILHVARRLGLAERDRTVGELNPWPHPFW